jgi:hypothetical protein
MQDYVQATQPPLASYTGAVETRAFVIKGCSCRELNHNEEIVQSYLLSRRVWY